MLGQAYSPFMNMGTLRPDLGIYDASISQETVLKDLAAQMVIGLMVNIE